MVDLFSDQDRLFYMEAMRVVAQSSIRKGVHKLHIKHIQSKA